MVSAAYARRLNYPQIFSSCSALLFPCVNAPQAEP